jgi:hypothetical protein
MNKKFIIYGLAEPHTGRVRYVGKTTGDPRSRYRNHASGNCPGTQAWVRSLPAAPFLVVLEEGTEGMRKRLGGVGHMRESCYAETKWLKRFRRTVINKRTRANAPFVWDALTNANPAEGGHT